MNKVYNVRLSILFISILAFLGFSTQSYATTKYEDGNMSALRYNPISHYSLNKDSTDKKGLESIFEKINSEIKRYIDNNIVVKHKPDSVPTKPKVDESIIYAPHTGKIIDTIIIKTHNVYDSDKKLLKRLANRTHVVTQPRTIAHDLLFKQGDTLDVKKLVRNLYLLRERSYLSAVTTQITDIDSTSTALTIDAYDKYSLGINANLSSSGTSRINIYEDNFLGYGNKLSISTHYRWSEHTYGGNILQYDMPNFFRTFWGSSIKVGRNYDYKYLNFSIFKNFINPTDYAAGLLLSKQTAPYYLIYNDSTARIASHGVDLWAGYSHRLKQQQNNLYITGRFLNKLFVERPNGTTAHFNPAFHNTNALLGSVGIYREKYFTANYVFGYGIKEYLPVGFNANLTYGYARGEFRNAWYISPSYRMGYLTSSGAYIMATLELGTEINASTNHVERTALNVKLLGFTRQWKVKRNMLREIVSLNYSLGWNRLGGSDEMVRFTDEAHPRGFRQYITGQKRLVVNTETAFFTPWHPAGFKTALFSYIDYGLIGDKGNLFKNESVTTLSIGVRFKNENLIFDAIEIRLGVVLGKNGLGNSQYYDFTNRGAMNKINYTPSKPDYINY